LPQWPAIWLISSALADPSRWHAEVLVGEIEPPMAHEARPRVENYPIAAAVLCYRYIVVRCGCFPASISFCRHSSVSAAAVSSPGVAVYRMAARRWSTRPDLVDAGSGPSCRIRGARPFSLSPAKRQSGTFAVARAVFAIAGEP
jgi:hypothetical protein